MFANYEFYQQEYHGTAIGSASSYSYYGGLAAEYIEQATFGRAISANENNLKKIKKCECRLADILAANHENGNENEREVKSESVGGWSRTFAENQRSDEALAAKISDTIRLYLGLTGLLYCGIQKGV